MPRESLFNVLDLFALQKKVRDSVCVQSCATSLSYKDSFGHRNFLGKPSSDPPLKWEKWRAQLRVALLAKKNVTLEALLGLKLKQVPPPRELINKNFIAGASAQSERETALDCSTQIELGKPLPKTCENWSHQADRKTFSVICLIKCREGKRSLTSENPHLMMVILTTTKIALIVRKFFSKPETTLSIDMFYSQQNNPRENQLNHFYGTLKELSENYVTWSREHINQRSV